MANLKEDRSVIYGQWSAERGLIERIQQHKTNIESLRLDANRAEREGDYGKVADCAMERSKMSKNSSKTHRQTRNSQSTMVKEEVTQEDIADVVAKWTGSCCENDSKPARKTTSFRNRAKKRVVGKTVQSLRLAMLYVEVDRAFKTRTSQWGVFCF